VGRLDLEQVDHTLGELLEGGDVGRARPRIALLDQLEGGPDLLVGAPLLAVRRGGVAVHRHALQRLHRDREHREPVGLELGQRQEQPVIEVLGDDLGDEQGRDPRPLHPGQPQGLARLGALDVVDAVVVERDQGHALVGAHRPVTGHVDQAVPVGRLATEPVGHGDRGVAAGLEAVDHAADELGIGDAAGDAVVAAVGLGVLEPVEAAEVGLEQDRRGRRSSRHHRLADPLAQLARRGPAQERHRRAIGLDPGAVGGAQRRAVDGVADHHRRARLPGRRRAGRGVDRRDRGHRGVSRRGVGGAGVGGGHRGVAGASARSRCRLARPATGGDPHGHHGEGGRPEHRRSFRSPPDRRKRSARPVSHWNPVEPRWNPGGTEVEPGAVARSTTVREVAHRS
jgi:hypothetical protein